MGTNEVSGPVGSTGGFYLESPSLLEFVLWVADLIQVTAILPEQGRGVRSPPSRSHASTLAQSRGHREPCGVGFRCSYRT